MASFDTAYRKYILPNEGGYANALFDKGGETYAGIARNYHPTWPGWPYIDSVKANNGGTIKTNAKFPDVQHLVDDFYLAWWNRNRFGEINSQDVANLLFDYNVNSSSYAIKAIQRIVGVPDDGKMGPVTLAAINKMNAAELYNALKAQRRSFFQYLVDKDPTQEKFLTGWLYRLDKFPDMPVMATSGLLLLLGAGLLMWYVSTRTGESKKKGKENISGAVDTLYSCLHHV
jgi:lysozyme family protein